MAPGCAGKVGSTVGVCVGKGSVVGGTDVKGYVIDLSYSFSPKVFTRLRYLSGNEIDGPPLGIDVLQLDMNATF